MGGEACDGSQASTSLKTRLSKITGTHTPNPPPDCYEMELSVADVLEEQLEILKLYNDNEAVVRIVVSGGTD